MTTRSPATTRPTSGATSADHRRTENQEQRTKKSSSRDGVPWECHAGNAPIEHRVHRNAPCGAPNAHRNKVAPGRKSKRVKGFNHDHNQANPPSLCDHAHHEFTRDLDRPLHDTLDERGCQARTNCRCASVSGASMWALGLPRRRRAISRSASSPAWPWRAR